MTSNSCFEIDAGGEDSVQSLAQPSKLDKFEGIAFSSSGNVIAVAGSGTNTFFVPAKSKRSIRRYALLEHQRTEVSTRLSTRCCICNVERGLSSPITGI